MNYNKTKIVATIGPASSSYEALKEMAEAGMNICRLNFSHGAHEVHKAVVDNIRKLNAEKPYNIGIIADLQGPKIRIGMMEKNSAGADEITLVTGDEITFTTKETIGTKEKLYITYQQFPADVKVDDKILINDGKIALRVLETDRVSEVKALVTHGGILSSKKGVNLPNTKISLPCLTDKDKKDLEFALSMDVEWVGLSFVRSGEDIIELKHLIANQGKLTKVIAKIEKPEAIQDIDVIIKETDAIMVARGDLGVEVPMQKVPVIQKLIVKKCLEAAKPVIIATQMMESMITGISPSRAEVNDVANSVMDGADALMLSGETSVGDHPGKVVEAMRTIIEYIEGFEDIYNKEHLPVPGTDRFISDSICYNASLIAKQTSAAAIITMTHSGYTAFRVSSHRPDTNILIFTDNQSILNMLNLVWGVRGFYYDKYVSTDHTIADIKLRLKKMGLVKEKDIIINIASIPISERGQSNMIKVSYVN